MKILYFGDVVGKSGRLSVFRHLPYLKEKYKPDFTVLNGENVAHGFGITADLADEFFDFGINAITLGNHTWDQREIIEHIKNEVRILRPLNYPQNTPGRGSTILNAKDGKKVLVLQVMGRLFMEPLDDPFALADKCISDSRLGKDVDCIIVDVHAEATSEKMAIGHYLDGRVSMVIGSHTHVPTADAQILPSGTAYQTDAGMCGDYNSIIGMKKKAAISKFLQKVPTERLEPAAGEGTVAGVYVETDNKSGLATKIESIIIGGYLALSHSGT